LVADKPLLAVTRALVQTDRAIDVTPVNLVA